MKLNYLRCSAIVLLCCNLPAKPVYAARNPAVKVTMLRDTNVVSKPVLTSVNTGDTNVDDLIVFARTLLGTRYKYASTDPEQGFDCSGFVSYVFSHFNIAVPRSSADYMTVDGEIDIKDAKPGDLILFTGTDASVRSGGHIGIIVSANGDQVTFIHSSSGKANGVTETPLNAYYQGRYLKTIRVFPQIVQ